MEFIQNLLNLITAINIFADLLSASNILARQLLGSLPNNIHAQPLLPSLAVITSIGLSDAIEYHISPRVHKEHNCPDIMRMQWKDYNSFHAFWSGVKCSYFLILPLSVFKHNMYTILTLCITNLTIPVTSYLLGKDINDPYYSHKMLYLVNPVLLFISIIMPFIGYP